MAQSDLVVHIRTETGKGPARRLRARGLVPAIFYGPVHSPVLLTVDPRILHKALATEAGENTLLKLSVGDGDGAEMEGSLALLKEVQRDPVTNAVLHADLMAIDLTQTIRVDVPINCLGTPLGVTAGGVMEQIRRVLAVECLPTNIPPVLDIDVSALEIGNAIHVEDFALPEGVTIPHEVNFTVVTIVAPTREEIPEVPAEEVLAEEAAAAEGEPEGEAAPAPDAPAESPERKSK